MVAIAGRGLSPAFIDDLRRGLLAPIRERVVRDQTLCIALRENYLNVYYRGANLLQVSAVADGYAVFFDTKYFRTGAPTLPSERVRTAADVAAWLAVVPLLKEAIDLDQPGEEREAQQLILRDNNFGSVARSTDYYVCDIEYAHGKSRFDIVAVRWPSTPTERKKTRGHRLVLGEVKFGDDALDGKSGLVAHVTDVNNFCAIEANVAAMKREMVRVFNQQRALGLVDCDKDLEGFSDEPPLLLLLLANHDEGSGKLRKALSELPRSEHTELRVVSGSYIGYGLWDRVTAAG
ncbi:MAG: hypothetical protein JNK05_37100 [Myxococcales bacterium]|nr:hypothetical protein [Myxococcales bacterium]